MFGDLFSQRGDYLDGMFYRGHMKYLRETDTESTYMPPDEFKTRRQVQNLRKTDKHTSTDPQPLNFNIKFQKKETEGDHHGMQRFKKAAHIIQDVILLEHFSSNHEKDWVLCNEAGVLFWSNKSTGEVSTVKPWESKEGRRASTTAPAGSSRVNNRMDISSRKQSGGSFLPAIVSVKAAAMSTMPHPSTRAHGGADNRSLLAEESSQGAAWDEGSQCTKAEPVEEGELGTGCLVYDGSEIDNLFAMLDEAK